MARQMKDSGVVWIGQIPEDWKIYRMKSCVNEHVAGAWGEEEKHDNGDYICIRIADFDYAKMSIKHEPDYEFTKRNYKEDVIKRLLLRKNDILIEKSGGGEKTPVGRTIIFNEDFEALYANFMERIRVSDLVLPKYMQYVFVTFYKNRYTINYIKQTTGIQNLDIPSMLASEKVALPTLEEQQKIADFLDEKVGEIDNVIETTKATIEDYKKYRNSLITECVTKGINPNAEMKNSGLEWNPIIPDTWNTINPKALFSLRKDKATEGERQLTSSQKYGIIYQDDFMEKEGVRVVVVQKDFDILKHVEPNDFVISMRSFQGGLEYSELSGCISSAYVMLIPNKEKVYAPFYKWFFKSSKYINAIQSTSNLVRDGQAMRYSNFTQIYLFDIPMEEQIAIADYLNEKIPEIDNLISAKEQLVEEMENYKKSLIYEYVTGKKEVE